MPNTRDDDSDTDWDSIYDEGHAEAVPNQPRTNESSSAKVREASNQQRMNNSSQEPSSRDNPSSSQPASRWTNEETPLLDAGPPPPSYSDVTANRSYAGNNQPPAAYSSIGHGPQSMQDVDGGESGRTNSGEPVKRREKFRSFRRSRLLMKISLLFTTIVLIVIVTGSTFHDTHPSVGNGQDGNGKGTYSPVVPHNESWWTSPRLRKCKLEHYSLDHFYEFSSPETFSFIELMEDRELSHDVGGVLKITAPAAEQSAAIVVGISIATTKEYQISQLNVKQTKDSLSLKAPSLKSTGTGAGRPCMVVHVVISIRPDINLMDLEVVTEHLNLIVEPNLFEKDRELKIKNSTEFTTISGDVSIAYWNSRSTVIDVISGDVSGTYALRDLLSIKTRSGTINVDVKPQPADRTAPAPADFTALTTSGSIRVEFPLSGSDRDIPEREYRTRTETNSGTVSGSYILGSVSTFKTTSGAITADVLPYYPDAYGTSNLRTETASGHTSLNLLSPFRQGGRRIAHLNSLHKSLSSGLTLRYPQEWEGAITGGTLSGSLSVKGRDVEVLNFRGGPVGKKIWAKKGDGASKLDFSTTSGSVDLVVGDL